MRSRRHRAIHWAKIGRKRKVKWNVPNLDDVIFLKPLSEDSIFLENRKTLDRVVFSKNSIKFGMFDGRGYIVEEIQIPKRNPIENFKNAMVRLGERLRRLRNANNNKK